MTHRYEFGAGADAYKTVNPANPSEKIGRYGIMSPDELGAVIERAHAAQAEWARVPGLERSARLNAFTDAVEARADALATAGTLEQGKLFRESKGETMKSCAEGRFSVGEAARMGAMAIASGRAGISNQILRRPRGVIFCISPWNFPISTPMRKICPALAFGNAVVMKPSQFTPGANFLLAEIAKEFFPANLIQVAMVSGRVASEAVSKGDIHGVSFTGSVPTGKLVYAAAAQNLIPVQLELGGKNGAILNDSNDLEGAITQILGAAFMTSGQRCTAISRVIVQKDLAAQAKEILTAKAAAMKMGPGLDETSDLGPLCNLPHWRDVCEVTDKAIAEGARALTGGAAPGGPEDGYFYSPTILDNVQHHSIAGQQEIFGPVLSVLEYETFDQAIEMLNGTEFGLTSSLFSNRNELVQRFLRESQNGMIHVNHGTVPDNNMPFGGVKNSGVGAYSVGPTAVNFYTSEHAAYIA
ncbi:Aldehyde dehydrogenase [Candidatus Rhodobacter oscarellae]|uniref:Aldehyde dehydrogenase n=1 Tax=Candidatus Rhodobacter oscarellae TaxID=1675527 RepID=A0A0J9E8N9_9RHOB|nr:aldehyde dehydrogenase family protein [Candidatus Rhodobacter lobularis]KMW59132.1 Aldehyde dehydrogenase [Candidatus Rhodobacter lobularis]